MQNDSGNNALQIENLTVFQPTKFLESIPLFNIILNSFH